MPRIYFLTFDCNRPSSIGMPEKQGDFNPIWPQVTTTLLRKKTLVTAGPDRLPVHTLTFAIQEGAKHEGIRQHRMDLCDYMWLINPERGRTSYSMSQRRDDEFDVTVKVYPNSRSSGYLDSLQVSDKLDVLGRISRTVRNPGKYVCAVAFGVGITEALPVVEAELEKEDAEHVRLLWANRTRADMFWEDRIGEITEKHPKRFSFVYILSREKCDGYLHGRISPAVLGEVFKPEQRDDARFMAVGTDEMILMAEAMFAKAGYSMPTQCLFPHRQ